MGHAPFSLIIQQRIIGCRRGAIKSESARRVWRQGGLKTLGMESMSMVAYRLESPLFSRAMTWS